MILSAARGPSRPPVLELAPWRILSCSSIATEWLRCWESAYEASIGSSQQVFQATSGVSGRDDSWFRRSWRGVRGVTPVAALRTTVRVKSAPRGRQLSWSATWSPRPIAGAAGAGSASDFDNSTQSVAREGPAPAVRGTDLVDEERACPSAARWQLEACIGNAQGDRALRSPTR